jgi:hypothetical protein
VKVVKVHFAFAVVTEQGPHARFRVWVELLLAVEAAQHHFISLVNFYAKSPVSARRFCNTGFRGSFS